MWWDSIHIQSDDSDLDSLVAKIEEDVRGDFCNLLSSTCSVGQSLAEVISSIDSVNPGVLELITALLFRLRVYQYIYRHNSQEFESCYVQVMQNLRKKTTSTGEVNIDWN